MSAKTRRQISELIAKQFTTEGAFYEGRLKQTARAIEAALNDEREQCAKIAEQHGPCQDGCYCGPDIADLIRKGKQ